METILKLQLREDVPGLVHFVAHHGNQLSLVDLKNIQINIIQRTKYDHFTRKVLTSELPHLVELWIEIQKIRTKV